jgi:effector-binding domain-containing protein
MQYAVRLETLATPQSTAVVRRRAAIPQLPKIVPEACGLVWSTLKSKNIKGAGRNVAVYLDDVMNIEVGVEMNAPFSGINEVVSSSIPAGTIATTTHFGPYQQLAAAHNAVRDWCKANGRTLAGPSWETYGHWIDEWNRDPSKIRTDIFYLLAKE